MNFGVSEELSGLLRSIFIFSFLTQHIFALHRTMRSNVKNTLKILQQTRYLLVIELLPNAIFIRILTEIGE